MHLHSIFRGAVCVADALQEGDACLVHCSDGWDRTSQLTSLAQLLLDPTYRSIKGFCQLIEKEWCGFGFMFEKRCGAYGKAYDKDDSSPVFVQWLDVVHQFYRQFPRDFEFDERLLLAVVDAVHCKWFGTFLLDCEKEREAANLDQCTISFWDYVLSNTQDFQNPLYRPLSVPSMHSHGESPGVKYLKPATRASDLVLWDRLFRRHVAGRPDHLLQIQTSRVNVLEAEVACLRAKLRVAESLQGGESRA